MYSDEAENIRSFQEEGSEEALAKLIHRHINAVYAVVVRLVGVSDADDVTQETFIKAWQKIDSFNPEEKFRPWILTIARNSAIDRLRKQKAIPFSILDDETQFSETIPDHAPLPDEIFVTEETIQKLSTALEMLSVQYREIILLHDMEDLTFEEIASIVGKPMNTVKSQYRRALLRLREFLINDAPK